MQDRKRLEQAIADEAEVARMTSDIDTLFELAREGESVTADIERELKHFEERLETLETGMLLSGPNDSKSAIMAIHPGAGGTESQDWAEMLLRMYLRWAERHGLQAVVTDRLEGEGAGIKSATLEINGENAYGLLRWRSACIGWCEFRPSTPMRGGTLRLHRFLCIRKSMTTSTSTSSPTICAWMCF